MLLLHYVLLHLFVGLTTQRVLDSSGRDVQSRAKFIWTSNSWSECTGHCNKGVQTRNVECVQNDGLRKKVDSSLCNSTTKPSVERSCVLDPCESWYIGEWDSNCQCPGFIVRPVVCYLQDEVDGLYRAVSPSVCPDPKPDTLRPCQPTRSCTTSVSETGSDHGKHEKTQEWITGPWSQCDSWCGAGTQSRLVWCAMTSRNDLVVVADELCNNTSIPVKSRDCHSGPCDNHTAEWIASDWSGCNKTSCDVTSRSIEIRQVMCASSVLSRPPPGSAAGHSNASFGSMPCDGNAQPISIRECQISDGLNIGPDCDDSQPSWYTSHWSPCSSTCGRGIQSRQVFCLLLRNSIALQLTDDVCQLSLRPRDSQSCEALEVCHKIWFATEFTECTVECDGGLRQRQVYCYDGDTRVDKSKCDFSRMPSETETCNEQPCNAPEVAAVIPCRATAHGCCPDGVTSALGPGSLGCFQDDAIPQGSCFDSDNGCCPDGITEAAGPAGEGCDVIDCETTEFGCCDDNLTAAAGPLGEGCIITVSCSKMLFGCCLDGQTPANGPNMAGCDVTLRSPQVLSVTSANAPIYDVTSPQPCRDGSGSCETEEDSTSSAGSGEVEFRPVLPTGLCTGTPLGCCPDGITARMSDGSCHGDVTMSMLESLGNTAPSGDPDTNQLNYSPTRLSQLPLETEEFIEVTTQSADYDEDVNSSIVESMETGVMGTVAVTSDAELSGQLTGVTDTPFQSSDDVTTVATQWERRQGRCLMPVVIGNCFERVTRWHYNITVEMCVQFIYSGCDGNENNFDTESECQVNCEVRGLGICALPSDVGPCEVPVVKWRYDREQGRCVKFTFGGCHGNANKFDSLQDCSSVCPVTEICKQAPDAGLCSDSVTQYYYDWSRGECLTFQYTGCRGNANRFAGQSDCEAVCKGVGKSQLTTSQRQDICQLPPEQGPCQLYSKSFYYDATSSRCETFLWGGCHGNANRFATIDACEVRCGKPARGQSSWQPNEPCAMKKDPGNCKEYQPMWYFEPINGVCRRFLYGGCDGNGNRFHTSDECLQRCGRRQHKGTPSLGDDDDNVHVTTDVTSVGTQRIDDTSGSCLLPVDVGPCIAHQLRWHYDITTGTCRQFHYGGCLGNANNFNSSHECLAICSDFIRETTSVTPNDACSLHKDPGSCFSDELRYYWDANVSECRPFIYGGCHGNGNNFITQDDCYTSCASTLLRNKQSPLANGSPGSSSPARRFYWPGDCYEPTSGGVTCLQDGGSVGRTDGGADPRWYYDSNHGDCVAFYYAGCGGNGNNFYDYEDCTALCSKVTEICGLFQCDLLCEFGFVRGPAGCLECKCRDPCQSHFCPTGMECFIDISSCETTPCPAKPTCRAAIKPGMCPSLAVLRRDGSTEVVGSDECVVECANDADCGGPMKCCYLGCNKKCLSPVLDCSMTVFGCCPDGYTAALEWNFRGCPDEAPSILDGPRLILAVIDIDVVISCRSRGAPKPLITWYRNGVPILVGGNEEVEHRTPNNRMTLSEHDSVLTIANVTRQDAASYACRAFNPVGVATKTFNLVVQVPARISEIIPDNIRMTYGETATFKCVTSGDPSPTVRWLRVTDSIGDEASVSLVDVSAVAVGSDERVIVDGGVLTIQNATIEDEGIYVCEAGNKVGQVVRRNVSLDVLGYFTVNITLVQPETGNVSRGDNMTLHCDVSGDVSDEVNLEWLKDGFSLEDSRYYANVISGDLIVTGLTFDDSGNYSCVATREEQQARDTISINVLGNRPRPDCVDFPTFADCNLLVEANLCNHRYYKIFCCRSCFDAGQLIEDR